jgi:hypothetical protein
VYLFLKLFLECFANVFKIGLGAGKIVSHLRSVIETLESSANHEEDEKLLLDGDAVQSFVLLTQLNSVVLCCADEPSESKS